MGMTDTQLQHIEEEEEEELEKAEENQLFDHISKSADGFYEFVGFTIPEFKVLYSLIAKELNKPHRGRKQKYTPVDQFVLFLHYLRAYPRLESLKPIFQIEPSTFENIIGKILDIAAPAFEAEFISKVANSCEIDAPNDFPECGFIVDATVQKINQPALDYKIAGKYFSGKHFIYCLKSQVIINIHGLAMHIVSPIEGSEHDKSIFDNNIDDFFEKVPL